MRRIHFTLLGVFTALIISLAVLVADGSCVYGASKAQCRDAFKDIQNPNGIVSIDADFDKATILVVHPTFWISLRHHIKVVLCDCAVKLYGKQNVVISNAFNADKVLAVYNEKLDPSVIDFYHK